LPFLTDNFCRIEEFKDISEGVWKIMKECWNMKASERPTFEMILSFLNQVRNYVASGHSEGKDAKMEVLDNNNNDGSFGST